MAPPFGYPKTKNLSASGGFAPLTADQGLCPWTPLGPGPKRGFSCPAPDDYGWQQDEYKLQNGQMDTLFVI